MYGIRGIGRAPSSFLESQIADTCRVIVQDRPYVYVSWRQVTKVPTFSLLRLLGLVVEVAVKLHFLALTPDGVEWPVSLCGRLTPKK
jgi:hypothetical protein